MSILATEFSPASAPSLYLADKGIRHASDRVLNYVWINRHKFDPETMAVARCGVPLHYIDRALDNAARYRDVDVNIWLDYNLLDVDSIAIVKGHIQKKYQNPATGAWERKHPNVTVRDLNEMTAFANSPYFYVERSIWDRVDHARFLAVQYCLETTSAAQVFYSDFDCEDVLLNDQKLIKALEKHGMVLGKSDTILANGFFGFDRALLDKSCWHALKTEIDSFSKQLGNVARAYANAFKDAGLRSSISIVPLPPVMNRFSPDPKYVNCGLNDDLQYTR